MGRDRDADWRGSGVLLPMPLKRLARADASRMACERASIAALAWESSARGSRAASVDDTRDLDIAVGGAMLMWIFAYDGKGDDAAAVAASVPIVRKMVVSFMLETCMYDQR